MILLYGLCILCVSYLYGMEIQSNIAKEEKKEWLSLKRLSYALGYHQAKNLGDSIQLLQYDKELSNFMDALKQHVFDVYTYIMHLATSDAVKKYYVKSYLFYKKLSKHKKYITCLTFDPLTKHLYAGSKDGYIRKWDITNPKRLKKYNIKKAISALVIAPKSQKLFIGFNNGKITQWDISSKKKVTWNYHNDYISALALDKTETYLYSGSNDKTIKILNVNTDNIKFSEQYTIRSFFVDQSTNTLCDLSIHKLIVALKSHLEIWNINFEKKELNRTLTDHKSEKKLSCFTIDPKTDYYMHSLYNKFIYFYNPIAQKNIHGLKHFDWVIHCTLDNDSGILYTATHDKSINIWRPRIDLQHALNHCDLNELLTLKTVKKDQKSLESLTKFIYS